MATLKLDDGTEFEIDKSFEQKGEEMFIDGKHISKCKKVKKSCKCGNKCKNT